MFIIETDGFPEDSWRFGSFYNKLQNLSNIILFVFPYKIQAQDELG